MPNERAATDRSHLGASDSPSDEDREIFRALYPKLRRVAAVLAHPEIDPDDLVQEALYRTLQDGPLSRLKAPEAYLRRAMLNLAANDRRRLGRQRRAIQRLNRADSEDQWSGDSLSDAMRALTALRPDERLILHMRWCEDLAFDEIARILNMTEAGARQRHVRALRAARTIYQKGKVQQS